MLGQALIATLVVRRLPMREENRRARRFVLVSILAVAMTVVACSLSSEPAATVAAGEGVQRPGADRATRIAGCPQPLTERFPAIWPETSLPGLLAAQGDHPRWRTSVRTTSRAYVIDVFGWRHDDVRSRVVVGPVVHPRRRPPARSGPAGYAVVAVWRDAISMGAPTLVSLRRSDCLGAPPTERSPETIWSVVRAHSGPTSTGA
jgi:hypothetical protein